MPTAEAKAPTDKRWGLAVNPQGVVKVIDQFAANPPENFLIACSTATKCAAERVVTRLCNVSRDDNVTTYVWWFRFRIEACGGDQRRQFETLDDLGLIMHELATTGDVPERVYGYQEELDQVVPPQ